MKKNFIRTLSFVLCLLFLCVLMPKAPVSAQITEDANGDLLFTDFAELQQICQDIYPDMVTCVYAGKGNLVITENLNIPQMITVRTEGKVTVAQGVELTVTGQLSCEDLVVEGTLKNYGAVSVWADMSINGQVQNSGYIYMYAGVYGVMTNSQNIIRMHEQASVIWMCSFETEQDLHKIEVAAQRAPETHVYGVYADTKSLTLTGWVSLPVNCVLAVVQPLTVNGGENAGIAVEGNAQITAELVVNCNMRVGEAGYLSVSAPVCVDGVLENKAVIDIYYDDGGRLTVSNVKNYIDHYQDLSSLIFFNSVKAQLPADVLTGLDVSCFTVSEVDDQDYGHYWMLYNYQIPESDTNLWGDVDGDGIVDSYDATLLLQCDVGMIGMNGLCVQNMDVSGDGVVDSYDATLILQYDVGMIQTFPAEN